MAVYYVDAVRGSDSNSGVGTDSAWKSVAQVNAHHFQPGDQILFRAGTTYDRGLVVSDSGTAEKPIVFGSYGDGPAPVFTGSVDVTHQTWTETSPGSHVWTTDLAAKPQALFINNGDTVNGSSASAIDAPREWTWSNGKLSMYSDGNPANGADTIEAQTQAMMLKITAVQHVTVENLHLYRAGEGAIVSNSTGVTLRNIESDHNFTHGLELSGNASGVTVEGGDYHDNGRIYQGSNHGHGIVMNNGANNNVIDGAVLRGNAEDGVQLLSGAGDGNVLRNCELKDNYEDGIDIKVGSVTIESSEFSGNHQTAINAHLNAGLITIRDNHVYSNRYALDVSETAHVQSEGNTYYSNIKSGVHLFDLSDGAKSTFTNDDVCVDSSSQTAIYDESTIGNDFNNVRTHIGMDWMGQGPTTGADELSLTAGADNVDALAGNDTVYGTAQTLSAGDALHGGDGVDVLSLSGSGQIDLTKLAAFDGFEHVVLGDSGVSVTLPAGGSLTVDGGAGADSILGGNGSEAIAGNGGDDTIEGGYGADTITGGDGVDTASYEHSAAGVKIGLGNGSATGGDAQGDVLHGVENLVGSAFRDVLTGDANDNLFFGQGGNDSLNGGAGGDTLSGGAGNDTLNGGSGNDSLDGGDGSDMLIGGTGHDILTGGAGADRFVFGNGQTGATAATRSVITDFSQGQHDLIDLKSMDADRTVAADQAFHFIGTAKFDGVASELHYQVANGVTVVEGDVNGDCHADFQIELTGAYQLTDHDFVL